MYKKNIHIGDLFGRVMIILVRWLNQYAFIGNLMQESTYRNYPPLRIIPS